MVFKHFGNHVGLDIALSDVMICTMLPELKTGVPGQKSLALAAELKKYESRNVTYTADDWPVFWQSAEGVNVWDADGNRFLDLTAAFGVAGLGHGWPAQAMRDQSKQLIHGMGDVHPTRLKVDVCRQLSALTFERWQKQGKQSNSDEHSAKTILSNSGFEAVESALKTALMITGKAGIISFNNSYHGMGYGALLGSGFEKFRQPFEAQLATLRELLDFPGHIADMDRLEQQLAAIDSAKIGALLVEPIQGRGGKVVPPDGFLARLREWCDVHHVILIFDEIFTGFNRTGKMFACEWQAVVPDLVCVGKSMSGGYPISACVGKSHLMDAWPESQGEALHTSTFLGNPVGCAMAVVSMERHLEVQETSHVQQQGQKFKKLLSRLRSPWIHEVRGQGLMLGVELRYPCGEKRGQPAGQLAGQLLSQMLQCGIIMLADGPEGNVLAFTPPFDISEQEMSFVIDELQSALDQAE